MSKPKKRPPHKHRWAADLGTAPAVSEDRMHLAFALECLVCPETVQVPVSTQAAGDAVWKVLEDARRAEGVAREVHH